MLPKSGVVAGNTFIGKLAVIGGWKTNVKARFNREIKRIFGSEQR